MSTRVSNRTIRTIRIMRIMLMTLTICTALSAALMIVENARAQQDDRPAPAPPTSQAENADVPALKAVPAGAPAEPQDPPPAPPRNGSTRPTRPEMDGGSTKVPFVFNKITIEETMPFIAEATGKVVIPIQLQTLNTKTVTVMNGQPIERAEALDKLIAAMRLNDVGVIETEDVVILVDITTVRDHGIPIPVLTAHQDVMQRTDPGNYIVKIYRLKEADAENVFEKLQEVVPTGSSLLTVDPNSNQIVLYGDVGLAQHIQILINELDHNWIKVDTHTFHLAYADASEIADQILVLFEPSDTGGVPGQQRPGRNQQRNQNQGGGGAPAVPGGTTPGPVVDLRVSVNIPQNAVTVSAQPETIAEIGKLIRNEWDLPRPDETSKVYVLKYTDPLKVRDLLQELLQGGGTRGAGQAGGRAAGRGGAFQQGGAGGAGGAGGDVLTAIGNIYRIEAFPDSNSLVVLSKTKESLDYLDSLIDAIDQPSSIGLPIVIELKHANAFELAEELNVLLAEAGSGQGLSRPDSGLSGETLGGIGEDTSGELDTGGENAAGSGNRMEFPWQGGGPRDDVSPESSLIGKVRIVPIVRQNALAVLGPIAQREAIKDLINYFDRPGRQVMLTAIIAEVELTDDLALGVRFGSGDLVSSATDNSLGASIGAEGESEDVFTSLFDTSVLNANMDVNVLLQALRQKSNVRILQEPRIFTADNQEARFFDGQSVPFITDSQTTDQGALNQSFDYEEVGVILNVRPRITVQRDVDMEINLELSSVVPGQTLFGGFILDRRKTSSRIIIKNGQTIVLSGILKDTESQVTRGIPLLSDIPLIGELFKSRENSKSRTELVAFITPIVVDNPSENDENFNVDDRERLELLSRPLKKQLKDPRTIRNQLLPPVLPPQTQPELIEPVPGRQDLPPRPKVYDPADPPTDIQRELREAAEFQPEVDAGDRDERNGHDPDADADDTALDVDDLDGERDPR